MYTNTYVCQPLEIDFLFSYRFIIILYIYSHIFHRNIFMNTQYRDQVSYFVICFPYCACSNDCPVKCISEQTPKPNGWLVVINMYSLWQRLQQQHTANNTRTKTKKYGWNRLDFTFVCVKKTLFYFLKPSNCLIHLWSEWMTWSKCMYKKNGFVEDNCLTVRAIDIVIVASSLLVFIQQSIFAEVYLQFKAQGIVMLSNTYIKSTVYFLSI